MLSLVLPLAFAIQKPSPPQGVNDKRLYTVATAHLDTNWLWTIQDTIREHLPKTLSSNFDLFKEFPDYVFNFEGAWRYMLIKEYYPERYQELKRYIRDGRWKVTGSWVDAVDANMPSPESLIRQCLYGNQFWKSEFGQTSNDIFLPDCFGFPYSLPTIAAHCGLTGFSTQKLYWGSSVGIPFHVGQWQGVDGSKIIAALDPGSYSDSLPPNAASNPELVKMADEAGKASGAYVAYRYHGTGDTGGSPKRESVQTMESQMHAGGPLKVLSASGDQLFNDLTPDQKSKLPLYDGELLLTTHGTGCYTSQAAMKYLNRKNELLADSAERAAVAADWLGGATYPRELLRDAWIHFLWHQFHDDLTGTSIPQVYPFSWNDEILSLNRFSQVLTNSAKVVASQLDTSGEGTPIVVYNPLGYDRTELVTVPWNLPESGPADALKQIYDSVVGPNGAPVPTQYIGGTAMSGKGLEFLATVPANGWSVFHLVPGKSVQDGSSMYPIPGTQEIESDLYKVRVDENGDIASIYDKTLQKELLKSPIRLALFDDVSRNWPSWEIQYSTVSSQPRSFVDQPTKILRVDAGPARETLRVERQKDGSTFVQEISLTQGVPRVDVENWVDWRCKGTLLKAVIDTTASNSKATYDLGIGTVQRGNNNPQKYEVPAQQWADLTNTDGSYGVSVLSDSKYGWDKPAEQPAPVNAVVGIFGKAKAAFIDRNTFERLRQPAGDANQPSYRQAVAAIDRSMPRTLGPGQPGYLLVYDFPYLTRGATGNEAPPPVVNLAFAVNGKVIRSVAVQSRHFTGPAATLPQLDQLAPAGALSGDDGKRLADGYAIIAFPFSGAGNPLPTGDGEISLSLSTNAFAGSAPPQGPPLEGGMHAPGSVTARFPKLGFVLSSGSFGSREVTVSNLPEPAAAPEIGSEGTLRLTLLHTAAGGRGYQFQFTNDLGHHHFKFAIYGHSGDWRNGTVKEAASFNQPLVGFSTSAHKGPLGSSYTFVMPARPWIKLAAVKKAENSDETVVRVFESTGKPQDAELRFCAPILSVREVNGQENAMPKTADLTATSNRIQFHLNSYQPRAFAVRLRRPEFAVPRVASTPISIPYDVNVASSRSNLTAGRMDPSGHAYAAELFPRQVDPIRSGIRSGRLMGPTLSCPHGKPSPSRPEPLLWKRSWLRSIATTSTALTLPRTTRIDLASGTTEWSAIRCRPTRIGLASGL